MRLGCAFNFVYAAFNMLMGILFASPWQGALALYYIVLGMMRLTLIQNQRESNQYTDPTSRKICEYYGYLRCGYMMFALNICVNGVVVQVIRHDEGAHYPVYMIGIFAVYALVMLNISAYNLVRYRHDHSPNFSATKVISFSMALMAILSLQTAMFSQFGQDFQHGKGMNMSLCCLICLCIHSAGIYMIVSAKKNLRILQAQEPLAKN